MRTKIEIFQDITSAAATALSTDHSRALSGAEWLKQLASELAERVKADAPDQTPAAPQAAIESQESPGEGWRWIHPKETLKKGDEYKMDNEWHQVVDSLGFRAHIPMLFRRRIETESPGEGWRWLEPGDVIDKLTDEVKGGSSFFPVEFAHGYYVPPSQPKTYRRRIV